MGMRETSPTDRTASHMPRIKVIDILSNLLIYSSAMGIIFSLHNSLYKLLFYSSRMNHIFSSSWKILNQKLECVNGKQDFRACYKEMSRKTESFSETGYLDILNTLSGCAPGSHSGKRAVPSYKQFVMIFPSR